METRRLPLFLGYCLVGLSLLQGAVLLLQVTFARKLGFRSEVLLYVSTALSKLSFLCMLATTLMLFVFTMVILHMSW